MPWTTPLTASAGANATSSSDYNTYLRDNLNWLYARPVVHTVYQSASADYSLTATSWTDVDATNLIATMTTAANSRVLVRFQFIMSAITGGTTTIYFDVTNGFTRSGGTNGVLQTSYTGLQVVEAYFTGVSAGSNSYKLQYQVAASVTATVKRSSFPIIVHAQEL